MFLADALNPGNSEFTAASEAAYRLLTAAVERCHEACRWHGRSAEVVAVSAWSLVHGLSALWISGRLSERITEQDRSNWRQPCQTCSPQLSCRRRNPKPAPTRRRPRQSLHPDRTISMGIPSAQLVEEGADVVDRLAGGFHGGEGAAVVDVGPAGHVVVWLEEGADADVVAELDEGGGYAGWLGPVAPAGVGVADEGRASRRCR